MKQYQIQVAETCIYYATVSLPDDFEDDDIYQAALTADLNSKNVFDVSRSVNSYEHIKEV